MIEFSIVIPCSRKRDHIERLLESIARQNYDFTQLEVHVVGNAPINFSAHPFSVYQHLNSTGGANQARQIGATHSTGNLVVFFDDDCWIEDTHLLKSWTSFFSANREVDIAGGSYQDPKLKTIDSAYNKIIEMWQSGGTEPLPHLVGGHLVVRKSVFHQLSFNIGLNYGGTETDFCTRAVAEKMTLRLVNQLKICHNPQLKIGSLLHKAFLQGRAKSFHRTRVTKGKQVTLVFYAFKHFSFLPYFALFAIASRCGQILSGISQALPFPQVRRSFSLNGASKIRLRRFDAPFKRKRNGVPEGKAMPERYLRTRLELKTKNRQNRPLWTR